MPPILDQIDCGVNGVDTKVFINDYLGRNLCGPELIFWLGSPEKDFSEKSPALALKVGKAVSEDGGQAEKPAVGFLQ